RASAGQQRRKGVVERRGLDAFDSQDSNGSGREVADQLGDLAFFERDAGEVENQRLAVEEAGRADEPVIELAQPLRERQGRAQHQGQEVASAETEGMAGWTGGDRHGRGSAGLSLWRQQMPAWVMT